MPLKCVVKECKSTKGKTSRLSFFQFPLSDTIMLAQWIAAVNKEFWIPTAYSKICELHFKKEHFSAATRRRRLKPNAIPTENLVGIDKEIPVRNKAHFIATKCDNYLKMQDVGANEEVTTEIQTPLIFHDYIKIEVDSCAETGNQTPLREDNTQEDVRNCQRRSTDEVEHALIRIQHLEQKIERLENYVQSLKEIHTKEMERQAEMFRHLMKDQKEKLRQKIIIANTKIKLLNRQLKRRDTKIDDLSQQAKTNQILTTESYETINTDFQNIFARTVHNEEKSKSKSSNVKQYTNKAKKQNARPAESAN